jgi:hypothetical protein
LTFKLHKKFSDKIPYFTAFIPANLAYKLREVLKWETGKLSAIYAMKNIQRTPAKALLTGGLM